MKMCKLLMTAAAVAVLAACGNGDSDDVALGKLGIGVTDAPVDEADKVVVRFTGIEVKPASGDATVITFASPKDIDLLALQGGNAAALISDYELPAGEYQWLRLMVSAEFDNVVDSYIEIRGSQHELYVPSGSQTGLKLNSGFVVPQGSVANYTIDFDLRKSVVEPNGQPGYFLKPSLRMVNNIQVGSVAGTIDSAIIAGQCEGTALGAVYVFSGDNIAVDDVDGAVAEPLASGLVSVDEQGAYVYRIGFLEAGDYTISYTCDAALDDPEADDALDFFGTQNIDVTAGATTTVNFSAAVPTS